MKDVIQDKREGVTLKNLSNQTANLVFNEPYITLGIIGEVCGRVLATTLSTYVTYAVSDAFHA